MHRCLPSCPCQVTTAKSRLVLAYNGLCFGVGAKGRGGGAEARVVGMCKPAMLCVVFIKMCIVFWLGMHALRHSI